MIADLIFTALGGFLILLFAFLPLELAFAARAGQRILRTEWKTDLTYFLGQTFLWSSLAVVVLSAVALFCRWSVPAFFREWISFQPWWLQALEVIFLSDLCTYWGHRLSHRIKFLWQFHSIHHSAEHLDWIAAYREHPFDGIYTQLTSNAPIFILGFPLETISGFIVFRGMWAVFIHSNVKIPLGPFRFLIGAPELHHWHHERARHHSCNFANLSPLMDILFGTFYCPSDKQPKDFGICDPIPRDYLKQIFYPFRFKKKVR